MIDKVLDISPKYALLEAEVEAYLASIRKEDADEFLLREMNTIIPGIFTKHFPHRIRSKGDLSDVMKLNVQGNEVSIRFDKDFMESLKYGG